MAFLPKDINPVGNKIELRLSSSNNIISGGSYATLYFSLSSAFNPGSTVEFSFLGETMVLNVVASPDDSGTELLGWVSPMTLLDWFNGFVDTLRSNYTLSQFFTITSVYNTLTITFVAKYIGPIYNLTWVTLPSNVLTSDTLSGSDPEYRPNFAITARVIDADTLEVLGVERIASNHPIFDFHEYLKDKVFSYIYFPEMVGAFPIVNANAVKNFYFEYFETALDFNTNVQTTETFKAVIGGVNQTHFKLLDNDISTYFDLFSSGEILVQTNRPNISSINLNTPIHFYVLNKDAACTYSLAALINYTDGSTYLFNSPQNVLADPYEQVILIGSPKMHDLESINPSKTIAYISYTINTDLPSSSDPFRFNIVESRYSIILACKNSFGTVDYINFYGNSLFKDIYTRTQFENNLKELTTLDNSELQTLDINSGWISKDVRDWYRDLLLSKQVYIIVDNTLQSFVITSKESIRHKDDESLYSLNLKLSKSEADTYYSKERIDIPGDENGFVIGAGTYIIGNSENIIGTL